MTIAAKLLAATLLTFSVTPGTVQVDEMAQPETKPVILVKVAPNWVEMYKVDFDKYAAHLDVRLSKWYTNHEFEVSLGVKSEQVAQIHGDIDEDLREDILEAVTDHFFDEYPAEVG